MSGYSRPDIRIGAGHNRIKSVGHAFGTCAVWQSHRPQSALVIVQLAREEETEDVEDIGGKVSNCATRSSFACQLPSAGGRDEGRRSSVDDDRQGARGVASRRAASRASPKKEGKEARKLRPTVLRHDTWSRRSYRNHSSVRRRHSDPLNHPRN
uniref:Uncharacterized protein n=1 Tax=Plectus sambesii TaxID=2011161 RepID=A0A914UVA5_9BILA